MGQYEKHIFVCTFGPWCKRDGDTEAIVKRLKRGVAAAGLTGKVRINKAGCLDRCDNGPVMVVYPEAIWYTYVDKDDVEEIIQEHLINGRIVERLKI